MVAFQPHRFTRTNALFDRFAISFNDADVLLVAPIFSAGEDPIENVTSENLAQGIRDHGHKEVLSFKGDEEMVKAILDRIQPGDLLLTLGAGSIYQLGPRILNRPGKICVTH